MGHGSKEIREFLWQQIKGGFVDEFPDLDTEPMNLFQRVTLCLDLLVVAVLLNGI